MCGYRRLGSGTAGSGDGDAAASVERAAPARSLEAEADRGRPTALRLAPSPVSVGVERHHHCPARDDHPVASNSFPAVLALAVARAWWSAKGSNGDPSLDPRDEPGQPALGAPRIHGELLKPVIEVAQSTGANDRARGERGRSRMWRSSLYNQPASL